MGIRQRDWSNIELAYLTGQGSYRFLAQRYGVSRRTLEKRGKKGGWVQKRMEHEREIKKQVLEADAEQVSLRTVRLLEVADKLLQRVEELSGEAEITPASIKTLSEALKNLRDAQMIKSSRDLQEQQARIDKLQKECSREENERGGVSALQESFIRFRRAYIRRVEKASQRKVGLRNTE